MPRGRGLPSRGRTAAARGPEGRSAEGRCCQLSSQAARARRLRAEVCMDLLHFIYFIIVDLQILHTRQQQRRQLLQSQFKFGAARAAAIASTPPLRAASSRLKGRLASPQSRLQTSWPRSRRSRVAPSAASSVSATIFQNTCLPTFSSSRECQRQLEAARSGEIWQSSSCRYL